MDEKRENHIKEAGRTCGWGPRPLRNTRQHTDHSKVIQAVLPTRSFLPTIFIFFKRPWLARALLVLSKIPLFSVHVWFFLTFFSHIPSFSSSSTRRSLNKSQSVSVSLHESQWVFMSLSESSWVSVNIHESQWVLVNLNEFQWVSMSLHES